MQNKCLEGSLSKHSLGEPEGTLEEPRWGLTLGTRQREIGNIREVTTKREDR